MLAALFEFIAELFIEVVLEGAVEILSEYGFDYFDKARGSRTFGPILRGVGYVLIGGILGVLSSFVIAARVVEYPALRVVGAIVSPLSMGLMLCLVSWFISRKDRHEPFWSTEKFIQGVLFGLSYSLTRAFVID
ncbi:MAG: hypothetical protein AB7J13_05655 [Pyrinomonadaceae bacterium]